MPDDYKHQFGGPLYEGLQSLTVLGEDLYMRMQTLNLAIVDAFLTEQETQLLQEYIELERTPTLSATFVSAISQLWVFGIYELLRTWRQRVREIISFRKTIDTVDRQDRDRLIEAKKAELANGSPSDIGGLKLRWVFFERAINNDEFVEQLHNSIDRSERVFRRIESLRVHLAKHEMPKARGSAALAPGYGRINMENGSIYYQVLLRGNEVDIISRRDIADECKDLNRDKTQYFLPSEIRGKLKKIPECGYGKKLVQVILKDGTSYEKVIVLWDREIAAVLTFEAVPFNASEVVEIYNQNE